MNKIIAVLLLCITSQILIAQGEANIWYFGDKAGLDFNSGVPVALNDSQMYSLEGCSTISDANGRLLFYSNGIQVWDRNHNVMPNGSGLLGDQSSTQSGIVIPHPGDKNLYYIFAVDQVALPNGLTYSIIDMNLNLGFGDVTGVKNELLHSPSTEKITAVKHANNRDIWVVTHKFGTNEFLSYLISDGGLNTTPVVSSIGFTPTSMFDSSGYIKTSPDGSKLAISHGNSRLLELFKFDKSTGRLSDVITFKNNDFPIGTNSSVLYGIEFSTNSNILYVSETSFGIYQLDVSIHDKSSILASRFELFGTPRISVSFPSSFYQGLQLGPDGKIYVAQFNNSHLGVINNPNMLGVESDYRTDGVFLEGRLSQAGLPSFIQSYFLVSFESDNFCLGEATQFTLSSATDTFDSVLWDFGDGSTSTDENPTHMYSAAGIYEVTLTVNAGGESSTETQEIEIFAQPVANPI